jgi:hypothetical protein
MEIQSLSWERDREEEKGRNIHNKYGYFQPIHHHTYLPIKMEPPQSSETSAHKIQKPGNYPEDSTLHPQHGESLKVTIGIYIFLFQKLSDQNMEIKGTGL